MAKTIDEKREIKAKKFITGAKALFKKFIPRDVINDIAVTECTQKNGDYEITGSVGTTSPTGKLKTFGYTATVNVGEDGKASLSGLTVSEI